MPCEKAVKIASSANSPHYQQPRCPSRKAIVHGAVSTQNLGNPSNYLFNVTVVLKKYVEPKTRWTSLSVVFFVSDVELTFHFMD